MTPRPLTIAVDVHGFARIHQGSRTFIENIYREIPAVDPTVRIISFGQVEAPDFPVWRHIPANLESPLNRLTWGSRSALAALKPDYVHYQYFCPVAPVGRSIITVHDILPITHPEFFHASFSRRFRMMLAVSIRFAGLVNTVSDFTRRAIAEHYRLDADEIAVVPNGVSAEIFSSMTREEARERVRERFGLESYVLSLSRIERRKNLSLLIDAVEKLHGEGLPDLTTVLMGSLDESSGSSCTHSRQAIAEKRVVHLNGLSDGDKALVLRAAEALVFPSLAEGFGIPPLEAMAAGIPVVAADRTAHGQIYRESAVMISGVDVDELAERLRELLTDVDRWNLVASRGNAFAQSMTWRQSATVFIDSLRRNAVELVRGAWRAV